MSLGAQRPTVVVVGGGFAGFWAALAARRVGGKTLDVVLASRGPMLQMRPRLYEADPASLQVDLRPLLARVEVEYIDGKAAGLDTASHVVRLADGRELPYTRLVVATGSVLRRPSVRGSGEALSIDTVADAIAFDECLTNIVRTGKPPSIAVIGSGFTGIELALELRERIRRHGSTRQAQEAQIVLLDRSPVVGRELGPNPRPVIEAALKAAHIELVLGANIKAMGHDRIEIVDRPAVRVDIVVLTTGMVAAPFACQVPGEHDELGRVRVAPTLQAPACRSVFVAGDAAAVDGGDGHVVLQSCQHALELGRYAGENAARDILGRQLVPNRQPPYITCLDLGASGAVYTRGWDRRIAFTGEDAKRRKRRINTEVIYPPADASRAELLELSVPEMEA